MFHIGVKIPKLTFAKEQTKTPSVSQSHTGLTNGFGHALLPKSVADVSPAKEILPQIQSDQKKMRPLHKRHDTHWRASRGGSPQFKYLT